MITDIYYFAYGSNLLAARLEYRINRTDVEARPFILKGYKLVFNCALSRRSSPFANIIKGNINDFVEGVLYKITPEELKTLCIYEGLYVQNFFHIDKTNIACTFVASDKYVYNKYNSRPDNYYLDIILQGCLNHGLNYTHHLISKLITSKSLK